MDEKARSARNTALMLTVFTILSYPFLAVWWKFIVDMQAPYGGFWILYGLIALGTIVAVVLMPLVALDAWKDYRSTRGGEGSARS